MKESNTKKEKNKMSFFKKFIISIKDFEKYGMFVKESIGQTIIYILLLILIFSITLTAASAKGIIDNFNSYISDIKEEIYSINYQNGTISINENEKLEIESSKLINGKILIDTSELSDEEIDSYEKELDEEKNFIIILKDSIIIKNEMVTENFRASYSELEENNAIEVNLFKNIIDNWTSDNNNTINILLILSSFGLWYYAYILDALVNILVLSFICYITSKILKLDNKFLSAFNIATHAITLPIVLNLIYVIIRLYTDFEIPYFGIMYYGIAYVYIITALFMMKSDNMKMQMDLQKIKEVGEQVKEELENRKQEEKNQREKDDVKKRDKEKSKPKVNDKPEGNNA